MMYNLPLLRLFHISFGCIHGQSFVKVIIKLVDNNEEMIFF